LLLRAVLSLPSSFNALACSSATQRRLLAKQRHLPNVTDDHRAQHRSKQRSKAASLTIPCKIVVNGVGSTPTSPMSARPCKLIDVLGHEIASTGNAIPVVLLRRVSVLPTAVLNHPRCSFWNSVQVLRASGSAVVRLYLGLAVRHRQAPVPAGLALLSKVAVLRVSPDSDLLRSTLVSVRSSSTSPQTPSPSQMLCRR
jgi:hypothetical protein